MEIMKTEITEHCEKRSLWLYSNYSCAMFFFFFSKTIVFSTYGIHLMYFMLCQLVSGNMKWMLTELLPFFSC